MNEPNPILNSILNSILTKLLILFVYILYRIEDRVNVYKVDGRNAYIDLKKVYIPPVAGWIFSNSISILDEK